MYGKIRKPSAWLPFRRSAAMRLSALHPASVFEGVLVRTVAVSDRPSGSNELVWFVTAVTGAQFEARSGARKARVSTAIVLQKTETEPDHPNGKADAQYSFP
eukprot:SAG11_NODE_129_length_15500_cov_16.145250_14_plen_102_part_00